MEFSAAVSQSIYALSVITSIVVCCVVWRHREKTGAVPLFYYVVSGLIIVGSMLVNTFVQDFSLSSLVYRSLYVGLALGVASLFVFALEYTGREHLVKRETLALLAIHPVLVVIGALVDPGNYFFAEIVPAPARAIGVAYEPGIGWWLHATYSYGLVLVSTLLFVDLLYRSRSLYRGQSVALVGGAVVPGATTAASTFGPFSFDLMPIGISVASVLFTVAIVRYRLIDVVPIARDRVLNTVSDGVFVIDRDDRLVDVNPVGRRLLDDVGALDDVVGRRVETVFDGVPEIVDGYAALTAERFESEREFATGDRYYHVRVSPIDDGRGRHVGWLFLIRDVTDRKRQERELRRQNERLERFADLVSHDLRNPLNVADGYLDLAREAVDDDAHLDEIERSHERMETIVEDVLSLAREGEDVTSPNPVDLETLADRAWENVDTGDATIEIRSSATILADADRTTRLLENLFRNSVEHGSTGSQRGFRADDSVEHGSTSSRAVPDDSIEHGSANGRTDPDEVVAYDATGGSGDGADGPRDGDETDGPGDGDGIEISVGVPVEDGRDGGGFWVEDDGSGIPEDERDRVFEQGFTTDSDGTGLGLSIVRQIAEAHGWSVAVVEGDSGGARFEFSGVETVDRDESAVTGEGDRRASNRS